jgi:hypothetical protein
VFGSDRAKKRKKESEMKFVALVVLALLVAVEA